jgi:hypothetical protein
MLASRVVICERISTGSFHRRRVESMRPVQHGRDILTKPASKLSFHVEEKA